MSTTTIVIAAGGLGDVLKFDSFEAADESPLYTPLLDPILQTHEDVREQLRGAELRQLVDKCDSVSVEMLSSGRGWDQFWSWLQRHARTPPVDSETTLAEAVRYRRLSREGARTMSDNQNTVETTTAPRGRQAKYGEELTIRPGTDKDGNAYGPENNPKRQGTKSYDRFNNYQFGETVGENKNAGVTNADIVYDADKGFIIVE